MADATVGTWRRWAWIGGVGVLTACTPTPRVDTASYQALQHSLDAMGAHATAAERRELDADRKRLQSVYFPQGARSAPPLAQPDWHAMNGMTQAQLHDFVRAVMASKRDPLGTPQDFPNAGITRRLLAEYRMEQQIDEGVRDAIHDAGKNTLDQFPITEVSLIPPPHDAPMELDQARIVFHMRNTSGYDAYHPVYHVRVTSPDSQVPLLDRTFDDGDQKTVIAPGADVPVQLTCCSIAADPVNNQIIKNAAANATIRVTLLDIHDHNNTSVLDTADFDQASADRVPVLERCIRILSAHVRTWVPPKAGEPECGPDTMDPAMSTMPHPAPTGGATRGAVTQDASAGQIANIAAAAAAAAATAPANTSQVGTRAP